MLIVLLLCSGIDMIGEMPNRVIQIEEPKAMVEDVIPDAPVVEKKVKTEKKVVEKDVDEACAPILPPPEPKIEEESVPEPEVSTEPEAAKEPEAAPEPKQPDSSPEERMIPFPEVDELEPGEKEVEALDTSEDGYKYYVYRSHNCAPCIWLVNELQKNVDEKDLILSYERTTKSGKYVTYVPVLEVYKDGKLVHQQTGYTSWKTIKGKLDAAN